MKPSFTQFNFLFSNPFILNNTLPVGYLSRPLGRQEIRRCIFSVAMMFLPLVWWSGLQAATCNWLGGTGNWSDASKWSCGMVPGPGDEVTINTGSVTMDVVATINDLTLAGFSSTILTGSNTLTVNGTMNWSRGVLSAPLIVSNAATFNITGGSVKALRNALTLNGTTNYTGSGSIFFEGGSSLINTGTFNWSNGSFNPRSNSPVTNTMTGIIDISMDGAAIAGVGGIVFTNDGIITRSGGVGTLHFREVNFINNGTFSHDSGAKLRFSSPFTQNGILNLNVGNEELETTGMTVNSNFNLQAGQLWDMNGTTTLNVNFSTDGNIELGGTLAGTGELDASGTVDWTGNAGIKVTINAVGVLNFIGGGFLSISELINNGTINLTGPGQITLTTGDSFTNNGTFNWSNGGFQTFSSTATITNSAAGTIDISTDGAVSGFGATFTNDGIITRSAGTGILSFGIVTFINKGTIEQATTGTIFSNRSFTNDGQVNGFGTFDFNSTFTQNGTLSPGLSPGILTIDKTSTTLQNTSTVNVEIFDNTGPGTGHDQLAFTGTAALDGHLNVIGINCVMNSTFTIITCAGGCSGMFATTSLPSYASLNYTANTVELIVNDVTPPTMICQDINSTLDASGNSSITAAQVDNGSFDDCGIASLTVSPGTFTCADVPMKTVTLTGTDVAGNSTDCTATVTVIDNTPPTALCQNIIEIVDPVMGIAPLLPSLIDNGSSDACGIATLAVAPSTLDCSHIASNPNPVVLTVTDVNGNSSTCNATVTLEDDTPPDALCKNATIQLNPLGNGTLTVAHVNNGSTDNCGIASLSVSPTAFDCNHVGIPQTATLTVIDIHGNPPSTCTSTITVEDNVAPVANCKDAAVALDATGVYFMTGFEVDNGSTDACGIALIDVPPHVLTCDDLGPNAVTAFVNDNNGNFTPCPVTLTVVDNLPPTALCKDITIQLDANGDASIAGADIDNGSNDNCTVSGLLAVPNSFACTDAGANMVTLQVTDQSGNVANCTATVTVEDNVPPVAVCKNATVQLDANGTHLMVVADVEDGSTDNCGIASLSLPPSIFNCNHIGTPQGVFLRATDTSGNTNDCLAIITVEDNVPPNALCQNVTVQLDANGDGLLTAAEVNNTSTDACGIASLSISITDYFCADVGAENEVTLTVTDNNGNSANCNANVTVEDNVPPNALCMLNPIVSLEPDGTLTLDPLDIDDGSDDNCGIASLSASPNMFTCADIGINPVTLTVTDDSGNQSTCTANLEIEDATDPIPVCQNITVQLDASGNASIAGADLDGGSTDACGIAFFTASPNVFSCANIGAAVMVQLEVEDNHGNVDFCNAMVTVEDNVPPTALCQDITVQLDANGDASITGADIDNSSTDNCTVSGLIAAPNSFTCADVGVNMVDLLVSDQSGNASNCTASVTVEDNVAPAALCQGANIVLDASGNASLLPAQMDNGSNDACGIASMSVSQTVFTCADINLSPVAVTLTVNDNNGNSATCNANVFVKDITPPTAICQNATVQLDASGNVSVTGADIDNGSNDACGIASLSASPNVFSCANIGANAVTLTVEDNNGRTATCNATVTVQDNIAPTISCPADIVASNDVSLCSAIVAFSNPTTNDNCSASLTQTGGPASGSSFPVGSSTISFEVSDGFSQAFCSFLVTVQDTENPTAVCMPHTLALNAMGMASVTAADIDNGSSDNCGIASLSASPNAFDCGDVGVNNVTLTVTDVNGNTSTCPTTVTVEDNVPPLVTCKDATVALGAIGNVLISPAEVLLSATDACGIQSEMVFPNGFTCNTLGTNNVTLTVTDNNGNPASCTAAVTIQDVIPPNALCQDITVQLDASGNVTIGFVDVDNGSNDGCAIPLKTISPSAFTCADLGPNNVTLSVTDNSDNSSSCTAVVTVTEAVPPLALCQDITVQLGAGNQVAITGSDIDNGSSDLCGIASLAAAPSLFQFADLGPNNVVLTVTDNGGNMATCNATVTVEPSPVNALCQDATVQLDANGNGSVMASAIDNGSNSPVGIASITVVPSTFACADVGMNTVTLTATDNNGSQASCNATVTVEDNVPPLALCQDITVQLDASGGDNIAGGDIDNGSNDACGMASLSASPNTFTCGDVVMPVSVTLTATDMNGNPATCTSVVTVEDNVPPVALCQDITVQLDASGSTSIAGCDIDNGSNDACGMASLSASPNTFDCGDVGMNNVTLTATDVNGNPSTCSSTVTVEDNVPPTALCKNITAQLDATGRVFVMPSAIDNGSSDACGIASMLINGFSQIQFLCANVGSTQNIPLTVTDANGNSSSCTSSITIADNVPPVALCQDITVQLDASGSASIAGGDIDNGSNDACGMASLSASPNTFACADVGVNSVTLMATDVNNNSATCTSQVTVEDNVPPLALCQDITVQLDANGSASIAEGDIDNGSTDACGVVTLPASPNAFTCADVGMVNVTLTATDANNNSATCTSMVTVEDNVATNVVCQNATVQLDASGNGLLLPSQVSNGSADACGIASMSVSPNTFTCTNVGANTVTLTALDDNGNTSTCMANVTVEDNVPPTGLCHNFNVQLNANGDGVLMPADIDNGSNDACGIASMSVSQNTFDCDDVGTNMATLTVTDNNGNPATCPATIFVFDNIDPTALCQTTTVELDVNGTAVLAPTQIDNGSNDACGIASMSVLPNTFNCGDIGSVMVVLTVTDNNGNPSACNTMITVEDTAPPTALCQNISVQLDVNGDAAITAAQIDNGSNDACTSVTFSVSPSTFTCAESGANMVTLSVTDIYNNTATCTATVTVLDDLNPCCEAPEAICQNAVVRLDANGSAGISAADVDGGSTADCGLLSLSAAPFAFDCNDLGGNTVTLTVTDINNDSDQCTAMVTVEDNIPPVALCQNAAVQLDASGNGSIGTGDIDAGTSDNCSFVLALGQSAFDCSHVGANTVTLTATDPSANSHSCAATVTVEDNIPPIAICQDVTVQLDANGDGSTDGAAINNGSTDACGIASLSASPNVFDCGDVGANTVVLTVTDANGNPSDCAATVMAEDNVAPVALCQDISISLDANGTRTLLPNEIDNGSTDACGIASLSVSPNMFDCSDTGVNTVTLTVEDVHDNPSTCTATVTIEEFITGLTILTTPTSCAGTTDGSITISASTTGGQIGYSIDGGVNFNLTGVYINLPVGAYNIVVRVFGIPAACEITGMVVVAAGGSPQIWYKDWDGDGYSDGITQSSCSQPTGYFLPADLNGLNNDCNDYDANAHPGQTWYKDADNDSYSDGTTQTACLRPSGYKTAAELAGLDIDCDDNNPAVHPGAAEVCNGIDDNCNGSIDEGVGSGLTWTGNVVFYTQVEVDAWLACYSVIDGSLTIAGTGITDLSVLAGLEEVTGNVTIQFTGLANMAGLEDLTAVGGTLTIYFNSSLVSLSGLENLATVGGSLMIYYNFLLADCCAVHGLVNGGVTGTVLVFFNKTGCNSVAEINSNCGRQLLAPPVSGVFNNVSTCTDCGILDKKLELSVFPNPASSEVNIRLNKLAVDGADVQFYDYLGRLVALQKMPAGTMLLKVDVAEGKFFSGEYFIKVKTGKEVATGRLRIIR